MVSIVTLEGLEWDEWWDAGSEAEQRRINWGGLLDYAARKKWMSKFKDKFGGKKNERFVISL